MTSSTPRFTVPGNRRRPLLADVVRAELSRAIINGEFPLGSKLPNEDQLCERFEVSRITLREAVQGLIQDGYVMRRQGSGTYVTRRPSLHNSLDTNFSYTEYLQSAGIQTSMKLISARSVPAGDETAQALGVDLHAPVCEVRRVRTADQHPAIYSIDYLPADIVDPTADRNDLRGSIYHLLAERGYAVDHGEAVITPVVADDKLAGLLKLTKGTLLQHMRQIDYDAKGRAVMLSLEWHVPSVIELRVYRRGPGPHTTPSY